MVTQKFAKMVGVVAARALRSEDTDRLEGVAVFAQDHEEGRGCPLRRMLSVLQKRGQGVSKYIGREGISPVGHDVYEKLERAREKQRV